MKILYILKHNPWGIGGGCYACRSYLEMFVAVFADATFDVLVCKEYLEHGRTDEFARCRFVPVEQRSMVGKCLSPITGVMHRHNDVARHMMAHGTYDYCIFDHNSIAGTLVGECRKHGIKTIVLNHNCEQEYFRDNNRRLKNMLLMPSVRRNECRSYRECDCNIFLTDDDRDIFCRLYGQSATRCVVGGCFLSKGERMEHGALQPFNSGALRLVISGTMGNVQNLDGINYFLDELYPLLPEGVEIVMTGKNPPAELLERVKQLANVGIEANPVDILSVINRCDIFVCPARLGGGVKIRIMDGLRCGLPIVAHKVSARGYTYFVQNGTMRLFGTSTEFKKNIEETINEIRNGEKDKGMIQAEAAHFLCFESAVERIKTVINNI